MCVIRHICYILLANYKLHCIVYDYIHICVRISIDCEKVRALYVCMWSVYDVV